MQLRDQPYANQFLMRRADTHNMGGTGTSSASARRDDGNVAQSSMVK
jgi:hypothetical protein